MFDLGSLVTAPRGGFGGDRRERLARALDEADAVVIGAGAGLSTAAGLTYAGPRFEAIFGDFIERYRFADMYSGGLPPVWLLRGALGVLEPLHLVQPVREGAGHRL